MERKRNRTLLVFGIVALIIINVFTIWNFQFQLKAELEKHIQLHLVEKARQGKKLVQQDLDEAFSYLEVLTGLLSADEDPQAAFQSGVLRERERNGNEGLFFADRLGRVFAGDGEGGDISESSYFLKAIAGGHIIDIENAVGELRLICAVPVYAKGEIIGVLCTRFAPQQLDANVFQEKGELNLLQTDGTVLNTEREYRNFFKGLDSVTLENTTVEAVSIQMQQGKELSLKYAVKGTEYYIYMLPVGLENGWYVSCMLPADVLSEQYREIRDLSVILLIENGTALVVVALLALFILYRSNHRMQGMKRELELIAANIPGGVFSYTADEKERFRFISNGLLEMVGYTEKEFRSITDNRFSQMILEPDRERVLREIDGQIAENGKKDQVEYRIRTKDGRVLWVDDRGQYVTDGFGKPWFYVVILDITEKKEIQEKIKRKEECLRLVLEKSDNIILELDFVTDTAYFSDSVEKRIGIPPVIHNYCRDFETRKNIHDMDNRQFMNLILQIKSGLSYGETISRFRLQRTGEYAWFKIFVLAITDENGAVTGGFAIGVDIDREMKENASLKQLAERDSLTGAFNKGITEAMVSHALREAEQQSHAFMMIDIDNFKSINDTHGHMAGDYVLKTIVERMEAYVDRNVMVGRIGGDELVVFMKDVTGRERVESSVLKIMERLRAPVSYQDQKIIISVSVGIAMYPQDGQNYYELFDRADRALYQAKNAGKNRYKFYND